MHRGFSLVELIVAVGLFTLVMTLASGAYLLMISVNRQAQGISVGINNLSFALETMTYNIRSGTDYGCLGSGDCPGGGSSFSFKNANGVTVTYSLVGGAIQESANSTDQFLTDSSVTVETLTFYVTGTAKPDYDPSTGLPLVTGDDQQPRVTIVVSGTVEVGPGKTEPFTIESGATMRGSDL